LREELVEGASLARGQCLEQALLVPHVGDQGCIDQLLALLREAGRACPDDRTGRATLDETGVLQPVEPFRHTARREHRGRHQLSGVQLGRAYPPA
jgi:hypothetical protein